MDEILINLEEPPDNVGVEPPITPRVQDLPLNKIPWDYFEKLCHRLILTEEVKVENVQRYGEAGQDQEGIDIFAKPKLGDKYWTYQCKRVEKFGPAKIRDAVTKFLDGKWAVKSEKFILCARISFSEKKRADMIVEQTERLKEKNISFIPWDCHRLCDMLKKHPDIVYDFFHLEWVKAFCGEEAAQLISNRSRITQVTEVLRNRAKRFQGDILDEIPILGSLNRIEVGEIIERFNSENAILLLGEAGTGKSGIVKKLLTDLILKKHTILVLRANELPKDCHDLNPIKNILLTGDDPLAFLKQVADKNGTVFLIVDQLDSVERHPICGHLVSLLKNACDISGIKILAVSRIYESRKEPINILWSEKIHKILSEPLRKTDALLYLHRLGIPNPNEVLQELAQNLLDLSIIGELISQNIASDFSSISDRLDLWERYRKSIAKIEGDEAEAKAIELAGAAIKESEPDFALELNPDAPTEKLISRNVLVNARGLRKRFRHHQIRDYFYAYDAALRRMLMPQAVISEIGEIRAKGVLEWMQTMYHRDMPEKELEFMREMFNA